MFVMAVEFKEFKNIRVLSLRIMNNEKWPNLVITKLISLKISRAGQYKMCHRTTKVQLIHVHR